MEQSARQRRANQAGKQVARESIRQNAKEGFKDGAKESLRDGAKDFGTQAGKDLAKEGIDRFSHRDQQQAVSNPNINQTRVWAQG